MNIVKTLQTPYSPQNKLLVLFFSLFITLMAACLLLVNTAAHADDITPAPSADFQPQDVVKIVVDALQTNSEDNDDSGIATVFRFASPGNRSNTGPLERFTKMIKGGFSDMLNHQGARFDTMEVTGDIAVQAVWLLTTSGAEVGYAFQLGKQKSGKFDGMWMTDAVVPLGKSAQSGTRI